MPPVLGTVLGQSSPVTSAVTGPATVRVSGLIACPPRVGVRMIAVAPPGTPGIVYAPLPSVTSLPPKPPLAVTRTPLSPAASSVIVPLIEYDGGVPASQLSKVATRVGRLGLT